jgi:hypothetical protein
MIERPEVRIDQQNFLVCVSASFGHIAPERLVEWFEYLRVMQIDRVAVYNHSVQTEASEVLNNYSNSGFIQLRQTRDLVTGEGTPLPVGLHWAPSINDCMYRNMHRFKWIIVIDFDEVLVPRRHRDILSMLRFLNDRYNMTFDEYIFRNAYFFTDLPCDVNYPANVTFLRCRRRLPVTHVGFSVKSIINPLTCVVMHNHYCWEFVNTSQSSAILDVPYYYGLLHHYKPCHFDNHLIKGETSTCAKIKQNPEYFSVIDDTMLRFKDKIIKSLK